MAGFAILVGAFLLRSNVIAGSTDIVDRIRITVPSSCSMSGVGMNSHSATISNGQHNSAIGETTIKVICNDAGGFAVYAVGYTDDEPGKNVLTGPTLSSAHNIATGTAITGNASQWAMKLAATSGNYTPIIAGTYNGQVKIHSRSSV